MILTKPLGTGICGTAIKNKRAPEALVAAAVRSMTTLNKRAAEALTTFGDAVHACTDVTGFGLVGHSTEMAVGSHATLAIEFSRLRIFPGALEIASANRSGGMGTNKLQFAPTADTSALGEAEVDLCFDPQTSGGLLASRTPRRPTRSSPRCRPRGTSRGRHRGRHVTRGIVRDVRR